MTVPTSGAARLQLSSPATPPPQFTSSEDEAATSTVTVSHPIGRREDLASVLERYGVSKDDVSEWYRAARAKVDLRWLTAGRSMVLSFADQSLRSLRYDLDDQRQLVIEPNGANRVDARVEPLPVRVTVTGAGGTIRESFYRSARQAGLPAPVISAMVDLLGWKIDFTNDVQPGDRFRVLYERRMGLDGRALKPGRVLAVEFAGAARSISAYLYEDDQGHTQYVDERGLPIQPAVLRYPLAFTEISSTFSASRFHPILKHSRPHLGVDFSAPAGTPVRAVAAGTVASAEWKGELGRTIEIKHGGDLVTVYAHLRGFHPSVRPGAPVTLGQVIGWVGQTGLATGPHLHYAVFEHGRYTNPLTMRPPPQTARVDAWQFDYVRAAFSRQLTELVGDYRVVQSTPAVALSPAAQARSLGPLSITL